MHFSGNGVEEEEACRPVDGSAENISLGIQEDGGDGGGGVYFVGDLRLCG